MDALLDFADDVRPRRWTIESAGGLGIRLAQQLVRAGGDVVDVTATLAARVRLLADRHQDLTALRTQAVCRLHALIAALTPGGVGRRISADGTASRLRATHPTTAVEIVRKQTALELVADIRRLDKTIVEIKERTAAAAAISGTTVTDINGVGPIVAALLIGQAGDITRFPTPGPLRALQGHRTHRGVLGQGRAAPAQPARQPAAQPRPAHGRGHSDQPRHTGPRHTTSARSSRAANQKPRPAALSSAGSAMRSTGSCAPTPAPEHLAT